MRTLKYLTLLKSLDFFTQSIAIYLFNTLKTLVMDSNTESFVTTGYTIFIILMNTIVQFFVSKKDVKFYTIIWGRDIISVIVFIALGLYWQIWIMVWQFALTYTGYLCWKYEENHGVQVHQIDLIKILLCKKESE